MRLQKAGTIYQMWRQKVFRSHILSKDTKLRAFRTLVIPVLLYGAVTWNLSKRDQNSTILEMTGELSMEDQLRQRRLQWFGHVWRMPALHPQRQLVQSRPSGKKRPPGGAPLHWCDLVNDDLSGIRNWTEAIQDRTEWRDVIRQHQPHQPRTISVG